MGRRKDVELTYLPTGMSIKVSYLLIQAISRRELEKVEENINGMTTAIMTEIGKMTKCMEREPIVRPKESLLRGISNRTILLGNYDNNFHQKKSLHRDFPKIQPNIR